MENSEKQIWYIVINPFDEKIYNNYEISHYPQIDGKDLRKKFKDGYKYYSGSIHKGYLQYSLSDNGKQILTNRHILRCRAVHGKRPDNCTVDHIDQNKSNDSPDNLRWATPSIQTKNQTRCKMKGQMRKFTGINTKTGEIKHFDNINEAVSIGASFGNISSVLNGKLTQTCGWKFTYCKLENLDNEYWIDSENDLNDIHKVISIDENINDIITNFKLSKYCFSNYGRISEIKNNIRVGVFLVPKNDGRIYLSLNGKKFYLSRVMSVLFLPKEIEKYLKIGVKFRDLEVNHIKEKRKKGEKEKKGNKSNESMHDIEILTKKEHAIKDKGIN
jgi:hypothetical protein